jgi:chloramphenicol-sensitive protein RarD
MDGPATRVSAHTILDAPNVAPPPHSARDVRVGVVYGIITYLAWGLVPLYFKLIAHVPSLYVLAHRVVWSVVFLAIVLAVQRRFGELRAAVRSRRLVLTLLASSALVAGNWLSFIYAISSGHVLQASLGYFILPLVAVLLGMTFLRERLRPWQAAALALATVGVFVLAVAQGAVPWVSLTMAITFAFYGLLRKIAPVSPLIGLAIETTLLLPFALLVVAWQVRTDAATLWVGWTFPLLMAAGVVTAVPLLWFATAARRLRLATMGFLQYIAPSCQFALAVFLYDEPFTTAHAVSFACIWTALVLYSVDAFRALRDMSTASRDAASVTPAALPE